MDNNDVLPYGWAPKGERLYQLKPGTATQRISMMGAWNNGDFLAPLIFEGYTNNAVFKTYLTKVFIPTLRSGQTVVMDNAAFHKGSAIKDLIESAGCFLKYLPTYSPDFNPIEHCWNPLKNSFRKKLVECDYDLLQAAQFAFNSIGSI
jgi:transposase